MPEFEIVSITPDAIVGKDQRVEIKDIATIEKREFSPGRTIGAGVLGYFAVLGVLFLMLIVVFSAGGGSTGAF